MLLILSACGAQVVEFPLDGGGSADAAKADGASADGASSDAASADGEGFSDAAERADAAELDAGGNDAAEMPADSGESADSGETADSGADAGGMDAVASSDAAFDPAPEIVSTDPEDGEALVPLDTNIRATFSEPMRAATLNTSTFVLRQGATNIPGTVTYVEATRTVTFDPASPLANETIYRASIDTGAQDLANQGLPARYEWTFTTTAAPGVPPIVLTTTPIDGATDVPITTRPAATFSKRMNPATISNVTFTVRQAMTPVPGTVTLDAARNRAVFTPSTPLGLGLVYTASISTAARDLEGLGLAAAHVWRFTTSACSQLPIDLRSAAGFAVLAGSTVTNTGLTRVVGDLGVSPGTAITGFPPGIVVGLQHAGNPAAATGIADLTTAYNDAAGRMLCPVAVAGNLAGQTLAPGLYRSTSSLSITSGALTLDAQGDPNAVFIFQMASTLTTSSGRVVLAGGAQARNVFWQVGSSATIGTGDTVQGTIMADQAITLNTGATLNGRALARIAAVSLDGNMIVRPAL